jgi:lipopolysaccharide transport system permease protein
MVPERYPWLYGLNPMAGVIDGTRWAPTGTGHPFLFASVGIVILLAFGKLLFLNYMKGSIADRV